MVLPQPDIRAANVSVYSWPYAGGRRTFAHNRPFEDRRLRSSYSSYSTANPCDDHILQCMDEFECAVFNVSARCQRYTVNKED